MGGRGRNISFILNFTKALYIDKVLEYTMLNVIFGRC